MFRTAEIQKDPIALAGIILLAYVLIFLLAPSDIMDFTVIDTEYWRETDNRLMVKSTYDYNSKDSIETFPVTLGEWNSLDYRYPDSTYSKLNADILLSRAYTKDGDIIWMDIIHSKVGESFHKQQICVEGQGWTIVNESTARVDISASKYNPYTYLYSNRLDVAKADRRQVMLYWFMFKKSGSDNAVTMIRLSSPVRNDYPDTFETMKQFIEEQLFRAIYENAGETPTVAQQLYYGNRTTGLMIMFVIFLFPVMLIFNKYIVRVLLRR